MWYHLPMEQINIGLELLKTLLLAVVEGITEWLPVSSTAHLLLVDKLVQLHGSPAFKSLFLVFIQLGAILAVVIYYFKKLVPWQTGREGFKWRPERFGLWLKIVVASVPAAVIGIAFDDFFEAYFYNQYTIGIMLIVFGLLFLWVERSSRKLSAAGRYKTVEELTYKAAFIIGCWQVVAAALPGTSRSGATIVGALLIGVSRAAAAEFTFYLAIPAMAGASLLKLLRFKGAFTPAELLILAVGFLLALAVSLPVIHYFISYIKRHDFKPFAYYRLILGILVLCLSFL